MFSDLKAMVVVLVTASIMFVLVKPVFRGFMEPGDFERRRNLWLLLTAAGFLSPNIWIYILVAAPALLWVAKKDANPAALYLMALFAVPPVDVEIPTVLINQLFTINQGRLLGLLILLPLAIGMLRHGSGPRTTTIKVMDTLLLVYGAYQLVLFMPYENVTNTMRRGVLFLLDTYLVYFVFSRAFFDTRRMADAMAAFCMVCVVVTPLAVFESVRTWLLYTSISHTWGSPNSLAWLLRGDSLRSQLSMGHSITMGYIMATGLAFWLYLRSGAQGLRFKSWIVLLLGAAIVVSYARATWIMAVLLPVFVLALAPRRSERLFKGLVFATVVGGVVMATPLGRRIIELLPFVGSGDQDSVAYRQQLAETSWLLIQQNPWFGSPYVYLQMEHLRQGEGIIDIVNGYAGVALFQGLVGLSFFAVFYFTSVVGAYRRTRLARFESDDLASLGGALVACMVATLVFLATVPGAWLITPLAGLLAGYSRMRSAEPATAPAAASDPGYRMRAAAA